jgi:P-type Ca2+ transporter type 2C
VLAAFVTLTYWRSLSAGDDHARAMAMVVLITASASTTAVLSQLRTRAARVVVALAGRHGRACPDAVLAALLHLRPLHIDDWLLAIAGGAVVPTVLGFVRQRRAR